MKLFKSKKGKNPFEASMPIDKIDVKVVTATYKDQPFLIGIGTSQQTEIKGSGQVDLAKGVKAEYESQKDLHWDLFYNPKVLPEGFMPIERTKEFMAGTIAATSGNIAVFSPQTDFKETPSETFKVVEKKFVQKRQNVDFLTLIRDSGLEIDHIKPIAEGGEETLDNLRLIPKQAHQKLHKTYEGKIRKKKTET